MEKMMKEEERAVGGGGMGGGGELTGEGVTMIGKGIREGKRGRMEGDSRVISFGHFFRRCRSCRRTRGALCRRGRRVHEPSHLQRRPRAPAPAREEHD